jgi:hypothetical protein
MRMPRMVRMVVVALVVGGTAGSIGAQSITGWRTPGGKLYFGDNPPRGSRKISTTYPPPPMGTASSDDVASAPAAPPSGSTSKPTDVATEPTDRDIRGTWAEMTDAHQEKRPQDPPPGWR